MAVFNKFNAFNKDLSEKVHNLATDVLKVMLTNTAPLAANSLKSDIVEIAGGNGYTAGGLISAQVSSSQTGGVYKLVLTDVTFTATGGSIAAARYAVVYNDTSAAPLKPLVGFYDYGSSIILAVGESLTVDFDATNGILQIN